MKKLLTICIAVAIMAVASQAQIGDIASIEKTFDEESASLCEHVNGEIVIETVDAGVVVTDEMPEGLALVNVTVSAVGGGGYDLDWDQDSIEVTLNDADEYTISFEVQVTDVLSEESINVLNTATATDDAGNTDSTSDDLDLLPYTYFYKRFRWARYGDSPYTYVDQDEIPVNTKVEFQMWVDLANFLIDVTMEDAYVKDNLGGNLELNVWNIFSVGTVTERLTGNSEKSHLLWEIGNIVPGNGAISDLYVSTDTNPGNNSSKNPKPSKQEYTDDEPTTHELNSGATLKFTASDTGLQCSVSTAPIEILTVIPD